MIKARKKIAAVVAYGFTALSVFAADLVPAGMNTLAKTILDFFTGPIMVSIFGIVLCGSAVAFAYNKDNEKIKKTCIALFISIGLMFGATQIIGAIFEAAGG